MFTLDAVFTWQFAPGSFINVVWKNFADNFSHGTDGDYFKNFRNTLEQDSNNNFSFKVIYFLDYLKLKKKKSRAFTSGIASISKRSRAASFRKSRMCTDYCIVAVW